jgi:chromosome segregation ATPase
MSTIKNSTRKVNRIPSGETPNSISPKKTKSKTPSPNRKTTRKAMNNAISILANMDYRENPEILNLLKTNKQYNNEINRINELQLQIQKNQDKIKKYKQRIDNNNNYIDELQEEGNTNNNLSFSEGQRMVKEIKYLKEDNKSLLKKIDLLEADIEKTEFLIKIWQSTKVDDNKKKQLEKEYTKKYKIFDTASRNIQYKINKLKSSSEEYSDATIEKLLNDQRILNDDFYRGYNIEIENIIN